MQNHTAGTRPVVGGDFYHAEEPDTVGEAGTALVQAESQSLDSLNSDSHGIYSRLLLAYFWDLPSL